MKSRSDRDERKFRRRRSLAFLRKTLVSESYIARITRIIGAPLGLVINLNLFRKEGRIWFVYVRCIYVWRKLVLCEGNKLCPRIKHYMG